VCAAAVASAVMSAALVIAAIALHPPVVAMPLIVVVCVGCPVFATWELPRAVAALRRSRGDARAIAALRRSLDRLPQVEHPLGH
jgi:hypothetical protein